MKSARIAFVILMFVAAITLGARAQTQVFVPGTASGDFGNPIDDATPLVQAVTVDGPGTITVTYLGGTVDSGEGIFGPNGGPYHKSDFQFPLQEAKGLAPHTRVQNLVALIGVFVPQSRVRRKGFTPIDGTKNPTRVGIMPGGLFFIGESKSFEVKQAGTLFLGINDPWAGNNSGGFNVEVSVQ